MLLDNEYVEIQGDVVQLIERRVIRQVTVQSFLENLNVTPTVSFPTLGRTQVFAHLAGGASAGSRFYAMTEIPAGVTNITKQTNIGRRRYRLAMPWTYLWWMCETADADLSTAIWSISDYRVFHARQRYSNPQDEMIVARLPNVYGDGRICWGSTGTNPNMSLADRLDQSTNEWYLSAFNSDLDGSVPLPYNEPNYRRWVTETRENPMCWMNWPEWSDRSVEKYSVMSLLNEDPTARIRPTEIRLTGSIPEINTGFTFARWEDWWMNLSPEERTRARISLGNLEYDTPEQFADPETIAPANTGVEDDGGVPA